MTPRVDSRACRNQAANGMADAGRKLREVDQLLNDPDVALDANRVWALLADIMRKPQRQNIADVSAPD